MFYVDLLGSKNQSDYEKKRELSLLVFPATSRVVKEVGVREVSPRKLLYTTGGIYKVCIHLSVISSEDILNFNVWFLLKCKFSFIMSKVGPEILELEQASCEVGANSEDQDLKLPPYV